MKRQPHPGEQAAVMAVFNPVASHVFNAFDAATGRTREFFASQPTEQERQRNVYLSADLTRFWACNYLAIWGLDAQLDRIWLPNNGVALRHEALDIRCLKSRLGGIPLPGTSKVKRAFFNQAIQDNMYLLDPDRERPQASVNLIVTWTVDSQGNLVGLDVHSPAYVGRDKVGVYWSEALIHPAESYEPEPPDEFEEPEDLPGYEEDRPDEAAGNVTG